MTIAGNLPSRVPTTHLAPFVWCSYGPEMLILQTWSVRSLARFGWPHIHLIVSRPSEAAILRRRLKGWIDPARTKLTLEVVDYPLHDSWGAFFFKPYVLARSELPRKSPAFIYCDADVLIQQDPRPVFEATEGRLWFHKLERSRLPRDQRTLTSLEGKMPGTDVYGIAAVLRRFGGVDRLHWISNAGFFQFPADRSEEIIGRWNEYTFTLDPAVFLGDQEALTVALHHMGLEPLCDKNVNYAMARHYVTPNLKPIMAADAATAGLDPDRLRLRLKAHRAVSRRRRPLGRFLRSPRGMPRRALAALIRRLQ